MPAKRTYNVRASKDFLVLAGIFFFLCLWAIKDGWYPGDKVLKKHPRHVVASFPVDGSIKEFAVKVGDTVVPEKDGKPASLLASLNDTNLQAELEEKNAAYVALPHGSPEKKALEQERRDIRDTLELYQLHCPKLGAEKDGKVIKLLVDRYDTVKAGDPILEIEPNKHFYRFNKSLAIFSFIAFWVFLALHFLAT